VKIFGLLVVLFLMVIALVGFGGKDEQKESENRPAIPGY
jgi:hypothetical protein